MKLFLVEGEKRMAALMEILCLKKYEVDLCSNETGIGCVYLITGIDMGPSFDSQNRE